jgi:plastocyanin
MRAIGKMTSSPRVRAGTATLLVGGMLTYAGVAGAAGDATSAAPDVTITTQGFEWVPGEDEPVEITTGQTVAWKFTEGNAHNLMSTNAVATDPRWEPVLFPGPEDWRPAPLDATTEYTFYKSGTYEFLCKVHEAQNMRGKIIVTGPDLPIPTSTPTPTPTPTPTATPTATATASPTPAPTVAPSGNHPPADDHTYTPAPSPAADTTKPALSGIKLRAKRRAARVTFKLSENATVTVQVRKRGAKKVLRAMTLQARAGTRTVVVRSSKLRKGRYTFTLTARDAMGNKSAASSAALRIRK